MKDRKKEGIEVWMSKWQNDWIIASISISIKKFWKLFEPKARDTFTVAGIIANPTGQRKSFREFLDCTIAFVHFYSLW